MHSRPTAPELLDAIQQHLTERLIPAITDPQLRFQTLVAAHVLGVVARELAAGEEPTREVWRAAAALLGAGSSVPSDSRELTGSLHALNHRLAEEIRDGSWDERPELLGYLKSLVSARLDVSNPRFMR